jgi:hypothetical protein
MRVVSSIFQRTARFVKKSTAFASPFAHVHVRSNCISVTGHENSVKSSHRVMLTARALYLLPCPDEPGTWRLVAAAAAALAPVLQRLHGCFFGKDVTDASLAYADSVLSQLVDLHASLCRIPHSGNSWENECPERFEAFSSALQVCIFFWV